MHIHYHLKTSDDIDVYEVINPTKEKLDEICDIRQPVIFKRFLQPQIDSEVLILKYGSFDVNIRDVVKDVSNNEETYLPMRLDQANRIVQDDRERRFLLEKNNDFINETGLYKLYQQNDMLLKPHFLFDRNYDFIFGSEDVETPLKYELAYRNYFHVTSGSVTIKLASPKHKRYLREIKDYENLEFRSPINPWKVQDEYVNEFERVKWLEITLHKGDIIYMPAYWWYTMKLTKGTSLSKYKYQSYMSGLSIIPQHVIHFLQSQNITRKLYPTYNHQENDTEAEMEEKDIL
jgi:hypothetical protein